MNNRRTQKYISILVRLILILICVLYIFVKESNVNKVEVEENTIEETSKNTKGRHKVINNSNDELKESREDWIADKLKDYEANLENYIKPEDDIELWICDKHIDKYCTVQDVSNLGFVCNHIEDIVYKFGEMYGNIMSYDDLTIMYSCTNTKDKDMQIKDCYLTEVTLSSDAKLKISKEEINFEDDLTTILSVLSNFNVVAYSDVELVQDYSNVVYKDATNNWKVVINTADKVGDEMMFNAYTLSGSDNTGLTDINYNLNIVSKSTLQDIYNKISM